MKNNNISAGGIAKWKDTDNAKKQAELHLQRTKQ